MGEMVNLHFLSLLEALLECRTVTLCKLIPMWKEVLFTDKNIKVRVNKYRLVKQKKKKKYNTFSKNVWNTSKIKLFEKSRRWILA